MHFNDEATDEEVAAARAERDAKQQLQIVSATLQD
jgi:hypothetical protein